MKRVQAPTRQFYWLAGFVLFLGYAIGMLYLAMYVIGIIGLWVGIALELLGAFMLVYASWRKDLSIIGAGANHKHIAWFQILIPIAFLWLLTIVYGKPVWVHKVGEDTKAIISNIYFDHPYRSKGGYFAKYYYEVDGSYYHGDVRLSELEGDSVPTIRYLPNHPSSHVIVP